MRKLYLFILILFVGSCKQEYDAPLRPTDLSLLVVEGVLNAGHGPTFITLSKSTKIGQSASFKPVTAARVSVEGRSGGSFPLSDAGTGTYRSTQLPLVIGQEYRLRIRTADSKEYLSDYVMARQTPAIDSIIWNRNEDGLTISVNSHDPSNKTWYYNWNYDETWEIRSTYAALYQWLPNDDVIPVPNLWHYRCWKYSNSKTIIVGSTAQLKEDVVHEMPILFIPLGDEKVSARYSILLRQYSLTKPAYEYLQLMKKNTQNLGSIFDAQPSELMGNIHCLTNAAEPVIGFLTASTISEKRIFITRTEAVWRWAQSGCESFRVRNNRDSIKAWAPANLPFDGEGIGPQFYYFAPDMCVDCVKRGGDLTMPSYW